jgi:hypothetical protein
MRPIYIFAGLAVLFIIYTEQQQQTMQLQQQQWLGQYNLDRQQLALQAANSPGGLINSIVGGISSIAGLAGYGLD